MNIILAFDGDKAGRDAIPKAAIKMEEWCLNDDDLTEEQRVAAVPLALSFLNYRGISTPDLICELQRIKEETPDTLSELAYARGEVDKIEKELVRRRGMTFTGTTTNNKDIIEAIKAKASLPDIIERYTDVIFSGGKYHFRCKLHGEDKHPSGDIDINQQLWICRVCNQGGDVFSFIELYEHVSFPKALNILGRYLGIDVSIKKPVEKPREYYKPIPSLSIQPNSSNFSLGVGRGIESGKPKSKGRLVSTE